MYNSVCIFTPFSNIKSLEIAFDSHYYQHGFHRKLRRKLAIICNGFLFFGSRNEDLGELRGDLMNGMPRDSSPNGFSLHRLKSCWTLSFLVSAVFELNDEGNISW